MNNSKYDMMFKFNTNLQDDIKTYTSLINLYNMICNYSNKNILLDFKDIDFVSANLTALLGGILSIGSKNYNHNFTITNVHNKIITLFRKNGFGELFSMVPLIDTYNSTMRYTKFKATTEQIEEFGKYIYINVLERSNIPELAPYVKDTISDNLSELFNNVIDHAETDEIFICGQYFPNSYALKLTLVDFGKTIKYNVTTYFKDRNEPSPSHTIQWALQKGNSTKNESAPGGLGLSILQDFLFSNKGQFFVISSNEYYHQNKDKYKYDTLAQSFEGTIITVSINLNDRFIYLMDNDSSNNIIF